jgi:predicted enzyme related to lactoylglutathione lyase
MTTGTTVTYAPGTPSWVDLGTSDIAAATRFYAGLFGWQIEDQGEQMGHYSICRIDGKMVAGISPLMNPQQPVAWSTYVDVDSAADTVQKARSAGGNIFVEPMKVMDLGTMAVFADPSGAVISIWQPGMHKGAELANRPNSLSWNELNTRDLEGAKAFYPKVFGWGIKSDQIPEHGEYVEWQVGNRSVAGALTMPSQAPAQAPSFWLVYFAVSDTDAAVAAATGLGAQVMVPATDIPQGRFSVITDPLGATFAIIKRSDLDIRLYGYGPGEGTTGH